MNIREIHENKTQFLPLLLLADEQEDMIDRYLERGVMYVLEDGGVKAECVVTDEGGGILELKNLAVLPEAQGKGYGKAFVAFYEQYARENGCRVLRMDTNRRNARARKMYAGLGYREIGIVPCDFNGISGIDLVLLEKPLFCPEGKNRKNC